MRYKERLSKTLSNSICEILEASFFRKTQEAECTAPVPLVASALCWASLNTGSMALNFCVTWRVWCKLIRTNVD